MEEEYVPYVISFLSSCLVSYFRIYSGDKFHNYFFLIVHNRVVILYCLIYGVIGIALLYILKDNVVTVSNDKTKMGHYLYPLAIGIIAKGVSDVNFFNVKTDGFSIPIGLKTFTQPLDKFFEEKFDGVCFQRSQIFMEAFLEKYKKEFADIYHNDIMLFKKVIIGKLNNYHPDHKKTGAFESSQDFTKAVGADDVMALLLREFGPTVFTSIFPLV